MNIFVSFVDYLATTLSNFVMTWERHYVVSIKKWILNSRPIDYLKTRLCHYYCFTYDVTKLNKESLVACSGKVPSTYRFPVPDLLLCMSSPNHAQQNKRELHQTRATRSLNDAVPGIWFTPWSLFSFDLCHQSLCLNLLFCFSSQS